MRCKDICLVLRASMCACIKLTIQSVFECKRIVLIVQILTLVHWVDQVVILSQILHVRRLNLMLGCCNVVVSHVAGVVSAIAESKSSIFLFFTHLVSDWVLDELVDVRRFTHHWVTLVPRLGNLMTVVSIVWVTTSIVVVVLVVVIHIWAQPLICAHFIECCLWYIRISIHTDKHPQVEHALDRRNLE